MAGDRRAATAGLRERKKQRTRATLIDAAVQLCGKQGFERTTVDQIAAIADVSPRTFSRYFPTKDTVAAALIDEAIDKVAADLARQPQEISHFEAMRRSFIAMYEATKTAPPGDLTVERSLCTLRIIMTSPTLRQAAVDYRGHAVNVELAKRMGVGVDDRKLLLVSALWSAILRTALADFSDESIDWEQVGIDDVIARIEATFAEFADLTGDIPQPV